MTLPFSADEIVTAEAGFFEVESKALASWIQTGLGDKEWEIKYPASVSLADAISALKPEIAVTRYLCVPLGAWSVLLNNSPLGTDVGVLPSYAARELGCRAIRAVNVPDDATFPARILEVYGPNGAPPRALERSIAAAKDGRSWVFETSGTPYPFEDHTAYELRIKSRRFTSQMLFDYIRALGVPLGETPDWSNTVMVRRRAEQK
ncbi:hypothetical protein [Arthrobacter bambusae]|uniref:Uncharacterized protein n=1 Tax=Arthrobacter bambusae TaxID=1338426 RepID=A0AAW8DEL4_9MICC|nr:hypothetical protein [Arthrobacter bambusae]MDP9903108.1 hypothetical protein [Arthrobacter bambusae]MDQ0128898.1 hypothetical protein [Arthrobacter bambusae]MDQ0180239.1 hypothetical protein [Arthrobacter bambusae]